MRNKRSNRLIACMQQKQGDVVLFLLFVHALQQTLRNDKAQWHPYLLDEFPQVQDVSPSSGKFVGRRDALS